MGWRRVPWLSLSSTSDYVAPGQKLSVTLSFSPMRTGVRRLLVDFDSDRLKDVKGATTVVVHKQLSQMAARD